MARHILAKRYARKLADVAASNVLLAFDFDGTLAPIVANPKIASMTGVTRHLLIQAALRYPCVVISGRAQRDIVKRLSGIPICHVSGNHGLEPWSRKRRYRQLVHGWVRRLRATLAQVPGIIIEDKRYSVTIHYRVASRAGVQQAVQAAIADLRQVRSLGGRSALNLVPRDAPTKAAALERARRLFACDAAMYVGDDDTDEEAFAVASEHGLSIRIGRERKSRAQYFLHRQREIVALLRALIALRPSCVAENASSPVATRYPATLMRQPLGDRRSTLANR